MTNSADVTVRRRLPRTPTSVEHAHRFEQRMAELFADIPEANAAPAPGTPLLHFDPSELFEDLQFRPLFERGEYVVKLPVDWFDPKAANDEIADTRLAKLINSDAERLWIRARTNVSDEELFEGFRDELELLFARHGNEGVRALSALILSRVPSSEVSWKLIKLVAESHDRHTLSARRDVLAAALESRDAELRYAAAAALGTIGDPESLDFLRKRLAWETNASVRQMIQAEVA